jgi:hypothetical protein
VRHKTSFLLATTPAALYLLVHLRTAALVEAWHDGTPDMSLVSRVLIFGDNWTIRAAPFIALGAFLLAAPVALFAGRRLATRAETAAIATDSLRWLFTSLVFTAALVLLFFYSRLRPMLLLPGLMALEWAAFCAWVVAVVDLTALLTKRPRPVTASWGLFCVFCATVVFSPLGGEAAVFGMLWANRLLGERKRAVG